MSVPAFLLLLFSGLTLLTFYRNEAWRDSITIYQDACPKSPETSPRAMPTLPLPTGGLEMYEEAIREAELAIELGQEHHEAVCRGGKHDSGVPDRLGEV